VADHVVVEADGGSRGNPGPAGYGAVVLDPATSEVLAERSESIGVTTNNVAEYGGLIAGLRAAAELGARRVDVRMDSKLVVEQMKGTWQVKNAALRELAREAVGLRSSFESVTFTWIPRAQNTRADRLANDAMDRAAGIEPRRRASRPAEPTPAGAKPAPSWAPSTSTPTRLVLVRHGATQHSAERRFSGRNDLELTAEGIAQAQALAARAASWQASAVVSSPLVRTMQTARFIADELGLDVAVDDDLAELDFGTWEGLTFAEARAADPDALTAWLAAPDTAPPGGESFADVAERVGRARDRVVSRYAEQTVVVVSHVTPIKTLLRLALDAPTSSMFRLHLDTASVSIVDYFADGNTSVRLVNATATPA
jgi:broad specificity phosphatase PhoE/ribonuclease HI